MLKEFKIGKKYRVLKLNELVKKYSSDIVQVDLNGTKGIKIPSDSTIYNINMENLNTRCFIADNTKVIRLSVERTAYSIYSIKPWMCEEVRLE